MALMKVDLIHKPSRDNLVSNVLSRMEEFQAISTSQTMCHMYKGEENLQHKIRLGYINNFEAQRFLGELCKGKTLKEVKLINELLKCNQSHVYVPQSKLRLLVLKEKHDSSIIGQRGKNPP